MTQCKWNGERAWSRNRKITLDTKQLEELGATGKTRKVLAKSLGIGETTLADIINKNLTNREAFDRGRLKANGK